MLVIAFVIGMPGRIGIRKQSPQQDQADTEDLEQVSYKVLFHSIHYHNTAVNRSILPGSKKNDTFVSSSLFHDLFCRFKLRIPQRIGQLSSGLGNDAGKDILVKDIFAPEFMIGFIGL